MKSLNEIQDICRVSLFDALDIMYASEHVAIGSKDDMLRVLKRIYKKAQLPYLKMESTGESKRALVESAQELLKSKDGPDGYYISYALSQFVNVKEYHPLEKDKLELTGIIAYGLLDCGETFQTILLMSAAVLERFTSVLTVDEFIGYYHEIVTRKQENTLDFLEELITEDTEPLLHTISYCMSKSIFYEKKQENLETAKTVAKIGGKVTYGIGVRSLQSFLASWAGLATGIVLAVAGADATMFVVSLANSWALTWFFCAVGAIGALYLVYSYWLDGLKHPVLFVLSFNIGVATTVIGLGCFIVNIFKAIGGVI